MIDPNQPASVTILMLRQAAKDQKVEDFELLTLAANQILWLSARHLESQMIELLRLNEQPAEPETHPIRRARKLKSVPEEKAE